MSVSKLPTAATFRRGNLPDNSVNLAYLATKEITPKDIKIQNISGGALNNVLEGTYIAGYNGRLEQGPMISDRSLYVTDMFKGGDLNRPMYFVGKSRYYHLDAATLMAGEKYNNVYVTLLEQDGSVYKGNYEIYVEPHDGWVDADGLPEGDVDEIPYRLIVHTDTDRLLKLKYNMVKIITSPLSFTAVDTSYQETLNTYPYFVEDTLTNVADGLTNEPIFYVSEVGDEYSVNVPAEPVFDSRKMEYFYWRVVGKVGVAQPTNPGINTLPVENPPIPDADVDLTSGQMYPIKFSDYVVNIGILEWGSGYPTMYQSVLGDLERSAYNTLGVQFQNPTRSDHSIEAKAIPQYWTVELTRLKDTNILSKFDVIIVPVTRASFPYFVELDSWSRLAGNGLIFAFDHLPYFSGRSSTLPNLDKRWGIVWDSTEPYIDMNDAFLTDHDICTGKRSAYEMEFSPTLPAVDDPYGGYTSWFELAYPLRCADRNKFEPLINAFLNDSPGSPNAEDVVAAVYEDRLVVLDPYSVISVLGAPRINNGVIHNADTSASGMASFYGLNSTRHILEYNIRNTYRQDGLKLLYNSIVFLAYGRTVSSYAEGAVLHPKDKDWIWSDIATPYIRSWVTTAESLTSKEIEDDEKLVVKDGKLLRKLLDYPTDHIIRSYAYSNYGLNYVMIGEVESHIETTNPKVLIRSEGDVHYAYTDVYAGPPFEPGIGYPAEWIRSDHWINKKALESADVTLNLFDVASRSVQVPDTSPTYATHSATWNLVITQSAISRDIYWQALGSKTSTTYSEEKKIISGAATFSTKSYELEGNKSTAYAWVYLPESNKCWNQGDSGATVRYWQTALKALGYYSYTVDGIYGSITDRAVTNFQTAHNEILLDGVIGPETGGRIADDAEFTHNKPLANHLIWIAMTNMFETNMGTYGRRSNPFGTVYSKYTSTSLQDYVKVTFNTAQPISRIEIKGAPGPSANCKFTVLKVEAKDAGGTVVASITPNIVVTPGQISKISFPKEVAGVKTLFIYVEAKYIFDQHTAKAFYWGVDYIQAYGLSTTPNVTTGDVKQYGKVNMVPGQTLPITLPLEDTITGEDFIWAADCVTLWDRDPLTSGAIELTDASAVSTNGSNTAWDITDDRDSPSMVECPSDSTTLTKASGTLTFPAKLANGVVSTDLATLVYQCDSHTTVGFHDGTKFVGTKALVSLLSGDNSLKIGVRVNDLVISGYTTEFHTEIEQYTEPDGSIALTGEDPPIGYFAYKPYAVRQLDGRLNVKLIGPPEHLGAMDPWYPSITFGDFTRRVNISSSKIGWQSSYTNAVVDAYYAIPTETWSAYGKYTIEHEDEQVQYSGPDVIHTKYQPLLFNEALDGRTDLTITVNSTPLTDAQISDISKDGTITLATTVDNADDIQVTYYTSNYSKPLVEININPYPGHVLTVDGNDLFTYQKIGLPIYVYITPAYCTLNGVPLTTSVSQSVIHYTSDSSIFDSMSDYYNPLAILVGIVSCSANVVPDDITILDARKRGGGNDDATSGNFYDNDYFTDKSYPCNGILVFDFDASDKDKEELIIEAIEKNVAAGTLYKVRWM